MHINRAAKQGEARGVVAATVMLSGQTYSNIGAPVSDVYWIPRPSIWPMRR